MLLKQKHYYGDDCLDEKMIAELEEEIRMYEQKIEYEQENSDELSDRLNTIKNTQLAESESIQQVSSMNVLSASLWLVVGDLKVEPLLWSLSFAEVYVSVQWGSQTPVSTTSSHILLSVLDPIEDMHNWSSRRVKS